MPLFRPGKPYRVLELTANRLKALGAQDFVWDSADEDGEWGASDLTSSVVQIPGLYVCTWALATTNAAPGGNLVGGAYRNGAVWAGQSNPTGFNLHEMSGAATRQLVAGDTVKLRLSSYTASKTFDVTGCHLALTRVGPVRWT